MYTYIINFYFFALNHQSMEQIVASVISESIRPGRKERTPSLSPSSQTQKLIVN